MKQTSMTAAQFRKMLAKGSIEIGKKGRLKASDMVAVSNELMEQEKEPATDLGINVNDYIFIPGRVYSSKNSKRILAQQTTTSNWKCKMKGVWKIVRPVIADSKPVAEYKKKNLQRYKDLRPVFARMTEGKGFPLYIEFVFVMPTKGRWDFNNLTELIQDVMVAAGWLPDDDVRHMLPVPPPKERPAYYVDKNNPGVYLKIV